jgi:uncharacterized protein YeaO (DUF488 family)
MAGRGLSVKRVYDQASAEDGKRILVDRVWPRGLRKQDAAIDLWLKDVAPSTGLRQWFAHREDRWDMFCRRYGDELDRNPEPVRRLRDFIGGERATLLYAARDREHNNAVALRRYLDGA